MHVFGMACDLGQPTGPGLWRVAYLRHSPAARQNTTDRVTPSTMLRYGLRLSLGMPGGVTCA